MRVLVTGHLGYLGKRLTPMVVAAGHDVVGVDVDLYRLCGFGSDLAAPDIPLMDGDLAEATLAGVEAIVDLAGLPEVPDGHLGPALPYYAERFALHVAETAQRAGVKRFVACGTTAVYRSAPGLEATEDWPIGPVGAAGRAAALLECYLARLAHPGFSPTYLRLPELYGSSPRLRLDLLVNDMVGRAYTLGTVRVGDDGMAWHPVLHVEDAARAILAVLNAPRELVHGEAFNVGGPAGNVRVIDLAEQLVWAIPDATLELAAGAGLGSPGLRLKCDKIFDMLQFRPVWDLRRGIGELLWAFRSVGLTIEDYASARYRRVAYLTSQLESGEPDDRPSFFRAALDRAEVTLP